MTSREWAAAMATIMAAWPHAPWPKTTEDLGWRLMESLDGQQVLAAVEGLVADGREFPPPPGLVRKRAVEIGLPDAGVLWAEVWDEVMRGVGSWGHQRWDEIPWTDTTRPFALHVGQPTFQELCLGRESELPVYEAQWRGKWDAWIQRERQQEARSGLPAIVAFEAQQQRQRAVGDGSSEGPARVGQVVEAIALEAARRRRG